METVWPANLQTLAVWPSWESLLTLDLGGGESWPCKNLGPRGSTHQSVSCVSPTPGLCPG